MNMALLTPLALLLSTIGLTFLFQTVVQNCIAALILRSSGNIRPNTRLKILTAPQVIKGDVVKIGPIRTTLIEVGDGEHLPSMRTGRHIKVPNTMLVSSAVIVYSDTIVDEVIAEVKLADGMKIDDVIQAMRQSVIDRGHEPMEVGIYQRGDNLVVHGFFQVGTTSSADERGKILKDFLERVRAANHESAAANTRQNAVTVV
ncbi:MAG: mechanosensitive ion channel [Dehalococcoidia bacterium]|nr:mechanosensitive ion channel [Dehalococcoidia bacterium]